MLFSATPHQGVQPGQPPGVSRWLLGLAVVVLLLIVGVTTAQLMRLRAASLADTERQLTRLDMVFAEQTGRAVETVDFILTNAIEGFDPVRGQTPPDVPVLTAALQRRVAGVRQLLGVALTDRDGRPRLATRPGLLPEPSDVVGRALAVHAASPADSLRISEPVRLADGKWTTLLTKRISGPAGTFEGIAIAFLNLAYFEDFFRAVELDAKGAIVLHHRDGTVLARYPHVESAVGTSFAKLPPFTEVLANRLAGSVFMTSPVDGSLRMVAIRALKAFPLAVNVSVDVNEALVDWWRETVTFALAAGLASVMIGSLLVVLARRSGQIEQLLIEYSRTKEEAVSANRQLVQQMAERERASLALRQAQRMEAVGQLTGGVAHEFNNLLTVLLGNLDLMRGVDQPDPRAEERLSAMTAAAERGATLTGQLLAFARRQSLAPRPVDLNAMILGMEDLLGSALGSRMTVRHTLAPALWPAMIDPAQLELVVLNLAINARDAMPAGGVLTITTSNTRQGAPERPGDPPAGDHVTIEVRDTGEGMTTEVLARAFEPFFTTRAPGAGSGLGLSQVFGTARQSGGGVTIDSTPGLGTVVRVHLPRAAEAPMEADAPATADPTTHRACVLVVDDDDAVRATTSDVLAELGYAVRSAGGGPQALKMLAQDPKIDVLLTDVVMPGMSGPALARHAKLLHPALPILFISGYADPEGITGEALLGRLVRKPFRRAHLAGQIEAALAGRSYPEMVMP